MTKFFLSFLIFHLLSLVSLCQVHSKRIIKLKQNCFWENKERKIVDTLMDKTAFISREKGNYILTIDKKRYFACNLADKLKTNKIIINGLVYQGLDNEKLIAIPLKIIQAYYY